MSLLRRKNKNETLTKTPAENAAAGSSITSAEHITAEGPVQIGTGNSINQIYYSSAPKAYLPAPPPPVDEYCGHENELNDIFEMLTRGRNVLLHTWGGVGKTEFALKLAAEHFSGNAVYLDCSNSVNTALANCTEGSTDFKQQINCAVQELRERSHWLAIFDNVQSAQDAKTALSRLNGSGVRVVLTARKKLELNGCDAHELSTLGNDAAELFHRYHIEKENGVRRPYSEDELACVEKIVKLSGEHTLTLELLAKTCRASGRSVFDILKAMNEEGFSLKGINTRVVRQNEDEALRFIEHLEKLYDISGIVNEHAELIPLMKKLCVLDVSDCQAGDLVRWCTEEDNDRLNQLARLGWLREKGLRYTMHNVVSEVLKRKLEPKFADIEETAKALNMELDAIWNDTERRYSPQPALARARALLGACSEAQPLLGRIANDVGLIEQAQGRYNDSMACLEKALEIAKKALGKEHPSTATTYNNVALLYSDMGDYKQALGYYEKALAIVEKVHGKEHPDTAATYNNIAVLYKVMDEPKQAFDYYEKALAIEKKVHGKDHSSTATTYNNIAGLYQDMGDYKQALDYYEKDLAISEKVHGKEHPSTATTYNNIAVLYKTMGDYKQALGYYEKALAIREKVLGKEHPSTATIYNNIAGLYRIMGEPKQALDYYEKALTICEKVRGKEHPNTAIIYHNVAGLHLDLSNPAVAARYFAAALRIYSKRNDEKYAEDEMQGLKLAFSMDGGKTEGFQDWLDALLSSPELP